MSISRRLSEPVRSPIRQTVHRYSSFFEELIHAVKNEMVELVERVDDRVDELQSTVTTSHDTISDQLALQATTIRKLDDEVERLRVVADSLERRYVSGHDAGIERVLTQLRTDQAAYLGDHQVLTRLFTGQKLYVDSRDASVAPALILDGRWEPETTEVFLSLLRPGDNVIDIGANVGYFGIIAGTVVDEHSGGSIHLIEANPRLIPLMFKSLNVTGLIGRSTVSNLAISDADGELELHIPEDLWGSSYLGSLDGALQAQTARALDRPLGTAEVVTVAATTLDRFVADRGIDRVDVVKIDIEGHEERAYQGMAGVVEANREHLRMLLEFTPGQYEDPVGFFDQIRDDFKSLYCIEPGGGGVAEATGYDEVMERAGSGFAMLLATNAELDFPVR
ncbi:MAG: FkbM family methyltransferase [Acidimicrobiales bacterium]